MSSTESVLALAIRKVRGPHHLYGTGQEERKMDMDEGHVGRVGVGGVPG